MADKSESKGVDYEVKVLAPQSGGISVINPSEAAGLPAGSSNMGSGGLVVVQAPPAQQQPAPATSVIVLSLEPKKEKGDKPERSAVFKRV